MGFGTLIEMGGCCGECEKKLNFSEFLVVSFLKQDLYFFLFGGGMCRVSSSFDHFLYGLLVYSFSILRLSTG